MRSVSIWAMENRLGDWLPPPCRRPATNRRRPRCRPPRCPSDVAPAPPLPTLELSPPPPAAPPDVEISAPVSTLRAVMTPANGAITR